MKNYEHIFTPLRIGKMTVKNRIETAPAVPFLASSDYLVTRELVEWARVMARGGAAVVTMGDSSIISEDARRFNHPYGLDLGCDLIMNGLSVLAEAVHFYGAKASIEFNLRDHRAPEDFSHEQLNDIISAYGDAAVRCLHAGMDMILVHGGHAHLLGRFFSAAANKRTDRYGGSLANRATFAIEVLEKIRSRVGDRLAIEYRLSAQEFIPGSPTVEETIRFASMIEPLVDLVHVSAGSLYHPKTVAMMIQPLYVPRGVNVHYAEEFRKALKIPVTTVGGLTLPMAEEIVAAGKADMVAMIRTIIADRDCVEKARTGRDEQIRPCLRCNTCVGTCVMYTTPLRCAVNPLAGRETETLYIREPERKKKVVVIGGGPSGMEAAKTAIERGHDVILFEKEDHLGGTLVTASALPFKADVKSYLEWAVRTTMDKQGLDIRLSTEATEDRIKEEKPDAIFVAAGAKPIVPPIPGISGRNVVWAGDVDGGNVTVGETVLLAGAGVTGCETALHLVQQGKKVSIIDMLPLEALWLEEPRANMSYLRTMLEELGVVIRDRTRLDAVTETGVILADKDGRKVEEEYDTVILSLGVKPDPGLFERFGGLAPEVRFIGDCSTDRGNIKTATFDGWNAAMSI
jgi:2,4-dienoyl-CoA reductase-like NADH-dependent reductase (Old Yellow Enzyme family)/NADPH-dependent 2,4-dienoyl-CoA reductase/sulfur reductase-like enzyme